MTIISFAHLADIHLGSFREKKLRELNSNQFKLAIDTILQKAYDFVLISGDIFNVPLPPLEIVEFVIEQIKRLKEKHIEVFVIGGSHDYSLTQKSFIDILDSAGVWRNVAKWQVKDTQSIELIPTVFKCKGIECNVYGVFGKKNGLDSKVYSKIKNRVEGEKSTTSSSFDIFMFHTTITQLLSKELQDIDMKENFSYSIDMLPKGFNYYAGGHIHIPIIKQLDSSPKEWIAYSGPLFPNSFSELKEGHSGFIECIVEFDSSHTLVKCVPNYVSLPFNNREVISLCCTSMSAQEIYSILIDKITKSDIKGDTKDDVKYNFKDAIVLLELYGEIEGKISQINSSIIVEYLYERGAYCVLKNTTRLISKQSTTSHISNHYETLTQLHNRAVDFYVDEQKQKELAHMLLKLSCEKQVDETNYDYEHRVVNLVLDVIKR